MGWFVTNPTFVVWLSGWRFISVTDLILEAAEVLGCGLEGSQARKPPTHLLVLFRFGCLWVY